jgi:hypothetical protein
MAGDILNQRPEDIFLVLPTRNRPCRLFVGGGPDHLYLRQRLIVAAGNLRDRLWTTRP